jgi:peptidoglycan/LPS O-acetylase OafA/YrhL
VAVLAVLINHLDPSWLPGGYLGVDLFFVISGYVVTGSLLGRQIEGKRKFLLDFYRRRFRRLMPALLANVLVTSLVFAVFVHPGDGVFKPALRAGMASLVGISNLYFIRQGGNYFAADNHYSPFLHTWSLGVEEQFYLFWPLLFLLCGFSAVSATALRRSLGRWSVVLSLASLLFLAWLQLRGETNASFFLMPARLWELAAGALVLLVRTSSRIQLPAISRRPWLQGLLMIALAGVFLISEAWRVPATLACVAISACLLLLLRDRSGPGRWLALPVPLALGMASYSLYLWHWPVIVLARWTVGINRFTLIPILVLTAVLSWLSFRLESRFRRPRSRSVPSRTLVVYPLLSLGVAGALALLQGPALGKLFVGDRMRIGLDLSNSRFVPGTSINSTNCFRDPLAPLSDPSQDRLCQVRRFPSRPTLFFEGDSHTEVLIPLGETLLTNGFNVGVSARGGCPAPSFSPRARSSHTNPRYKFCTADTNARLERRLRQIAPGDALVLSIKLPGYLMEENNIQSGAAVAAFQASIRDLASRLEARKAELILFGPLPLFEQRSSLAVPASLCLPEWYRPSNAASPGCQPSRVKRQEELRRLAPLEQLLQSLEKEIPNLRVFHSFPIVCPPQQRECSTHRGSTMLFTDSNHLSLHGMRLLEKPFLAFLGKGTVAGTIPAAKPQGPQREVSP